MIVGVTTAALIVLLERTSLGALGMVVAVIFTSALARWADWTSVATLRDLGEMFVQMIELHPTEEHWYLPVTGVDPAAQGRGMGTTVLRYGLSLAARDGVPAYLEASSPRSRALYMRLGFEVMDEIQAGSSPRVWAMIRQPGTVGSLV